MASTAATKIDALIYDAVFGTDAQKEQNRKAIRELALSQGIFPASIQGLYDASGKGLYKGITVPAINIRGITYPGARAVFRAAMKNHVGPFTFEIARSEIGYTDQKPVEYSTCILAAAIKEGYRGPVFIQGDHYQVSEKKYSAEPDKEINAIKDLIRESIAAGFYNIDIDASTIVELNKTNLDEEQEKNCRVTADLTKFIRSIQPVGVTVSVGAEIGEVGGRNSTTDDLDAFMRGYIKLLGPQVKGISKISVQTGTTHGGVVLPNGKIAQVEVDFKTLEKLSKLAREKYGLGGAVQHGASTLPDEAFDMFPKEGTAEVHLATGFQNITFDSKAFPAVLLKEIDQYIFDNYKAERSSKDTDEQFIYK